MKKIVRLTEGDLHRIIKESVNKVLKEYTDFDKIKMYGRPNDYNYLDKEENYDDEYYDDENFMAPEGYPNRMYPDLEVV